MLLTGVGTHPVGVAHGAVVHTIGTDAARGSGCIPTQPYHAVATLGLQVEYFAALRRGGETCAHHRGAVGSAVGHHPHIVLCAGIQTGKGVLWAARHHIGRIPCSGKAVGVGYIAPVTQRQAGVLGPCHCCVKGIDRSGVQIGHAGARGRGLYRKVVYKCQSCTRCVVVREHHIARVGDIVFREVETHKGVVIIRWDGVQPLHRVAQAGDVAHTKHAGTG